MIQHFIVIYIIKFAPEFIKIVILSLSELYTQYTLQWNI